MSIAPAIGAALIGGATSIIGGIFGASQADKQNRQARKAQKKHRKLQKKQLMQLTNTIKEYLKLINKIIKTTELTSGILL